MPTSTAALSVAAAQSEAVPDAQVAGLPELGAVLVKDVEDTTANVQATILPSLVPATFRVEYGRTGPTARRRTGSPWRRASCRGPARPP